VSRLSHSFGTPEIDGRLGQQFCLEPALHERSEESILRI
jgi:hypothetical protein